jgi:hypothetical protein
MIARVALMRRGSTGSHASGRLDTGAVVVVLVSPSLFVNTGPDSGCTYVSQVEQVPSPGARDAADRGSITSTLHFCPAVSVGHTDRCVPQMLGPIRGEC